MGPRLFASYAIAQALSLGVFFLLPPGTWAATFWQVAIGWVAAAFALRQARQGGEGSRAIGYLFGAGLLLNDSGIFVEQILSHFFSAPASPNLADAFWLALYPCLITGLSIVVYRRSGDDDNDGIVASTAISTVITIGLGLVAWELVIVPKTVVQDVSVGQLLIVTAYPTGDLVLIALALRLLFSGTARSPAFLLLFASVLCFLGADMGWVAPLRTGEPLSAGVRQVLAATSLAAYCLMGAAVGHRSFPDLVQPSQRPGTRATPAMLGSLAVSLLIAPTVLAVEAILDKLYGAMGP